MAEERLRAAWCGRARRDGAGTSSPAGACGERRMLSIGGLRCGMSSRAGRELAPVAASGDSPPEDCLGCSAVLAGPGQVDVGFAQKGKSRERGIGNGDRSNAPASISQVDCIECPVVGAVIQSIQLERQLPI